MSLNFCAIDFETASFDRASAIQIGLVKVVDGQIQETYTSFLKPHPDHAFMDPRAQHVHGIDIRTIETAPSWKDIHQDVIDFVQDLPVIAHNLGFDGKVLFEICQIEGITPPSWAMGDTLQWSRNLLKLPSHTLRAVVDHLAITLDQHHEAVADAVACAEITLRLAQTVSAGSIQELGATAGYFVENLNDWAISRTTNRAVLPRPVITPDQWAQFQSLLANQAPPPQSLDGLTVVFTGQMAIKRDEAAALAKAQGAKVTGSVSRNTDVLVVGHDPRTEHFDKVLFSGKVKKAIDLSVETNRLAVISEYQFYDLVAETEPLTEGGDTES